MKFKISWLTLAAIVLLSLGTSVGLAERTKPEVSLSLCSSFSFGGIGVAGTMSQGERALREILKESDAVARLEGLLPQASPAGQLYALVALRLRDRAAYQRALEKFRANDAKVETARGCMLQQESFRDLIKEIEQGHYDSFLEREWPKEMR
jgi:hypothetical protein